MVDGLGFFKRGLVKRGNRQWPKTVRHQSKRDFEHFTYSFSSQFVALLTKVGKNVVRLVDVSNPPSFCHRPASIKSSIRVT